MRLTLTLRRARNRLTAFRINLLASLAYYFHGYTPSPGPYAVPSVGVLGSFVPPCAFPSQRRTPNYLYWTRVPFKALTGPNLLRLLALAYSFAWLCYYSSTYDVVHRDPAALLSVRIRTPGLLPRLRASGFTNQDIRCTVVGENWNLSEVSDCADWTPPAAVVTTHYHWEYFLRLCTSIFWLVRLLFYTPIISPVRSFYRLAGSAELRSAFRNIHVPVWTPPANHHSHPEAAAARNSADAAINTFVRLRGYEPYSVQLSSRDIADGISGSLRHLWPVDYHSPEQSDPVLRMSVLKFINVDYYVDWCDYLWMAQPIMLYTFTPRDPCGVYKETTWTVDSEQNIIMTVAGGARYRHPLWDYNVDNFSATYPGVTIQYAVESVPVDEHWSIVLMLPRCVTHGSFSLTPTHTLRRKQMYSVVKTMDEGERPSAMIRCSDASLSIGVPGTYSSIRVPPLLQAVLHSRISLSKLKIHDLPSLLTKDFGDDTRLACATVFSAFPAQPPLRGSVHTPYRLVDEDIAYRKVGKPAFVLQESLTATVISPPVLVGVCAPVKSRANDKWCVQERITAVHNEQIKFTGRYLGYAAEFSKLLLPTPHVLAPVEVGEVIASQKRPTQVRNNLQASPRLSDWLAVGELEVKSFQKAESYADPKPPRNISTLPTEHCLIYSQYTQPLAKLLKSLPWYAFGHHPDQVAERVHAVASQATTLTETDFSKFDGTHSHALYQFELALLLRAFPRAEHPTIIRIHDMMTSAEARTTTGVHYDPDGGRLSGCADTSLMNSLDNAFVAYSVYRRMHMSPADAWKKLGVYGGDDGISADADPAMYDSVVKDLGLRLKARTVPAHLRTSFLGRIYPAPAAGPWHMADLPRQLSKLHVHASREPVDPWVPLYNKASGHLVTDAHSPILGDWARMVMRLCPEQFKVVRVDMQSYMMRPYTELQYVPPADMALACALDQLQISTAELEDYCDHLSKLGDIALLRPLKEPLPLIPPPGVIVGTSEVGLDAKRAGEPEEKKPLSPDNPFECKGCAVLFGTGKTPEHYAKAKLSNPAWCKPCKEKRQLARDAKAGGEKSDRGVASKKKKAKPPRGVNS